MSLAIEVEKAVVLLDRFPALAELDLTLPARAVALIQGPNGAGKTTLLRLLAGLVRLESGSARVLGLDVAGQSRAVRSQAGFLAPSAMMYADLTVAENLRFWATVSGRPDDQIDRTMARVGIAELADQPVASLSTGQLRRAALAAVAARRPRLWLLDEPHAGLDQAGRTMVDELIAEAVDAGATVIVASHELDRVRPLATHVVTIAGGAVHSIEAMADA